MDPENFRLFDFIQFQNQNFPKTDAITSKVNGKWEKTSTQSVIGLANQLSRGLLKLGIQPGDRIAIISNNRTEWNITDLGILQIGAIDVPVYPTISESDYEYIFNDAEVKLVFVSDQELLNKVLAIKDKVPSLTDIYTFDKIEGASNWIEVLNLNVEGDQEEVEKLKREVKSTDLATLIYTSGTTGKPKGVMLSHHNIASNVLGSKERLPVNEDARGVSFLPLCHIYERMIIYLYYFTGVSIYYAESMETIGTDIKDVKPEVFTAVPRLLEKVFDKIMAKGEDLSGIKRALFFWAVSVGEKYQPYGAAGPVYEIKLKIARKLIFSKWQEALGGKVKAVASGSAALNPRLARIFNAAGIPVLEGYGLTETSPVISVNSFENNGFKIGTTGRPLKDVKVKIAPDGEILVKGPNVMMGYYKQPDLTNEVIDEDGWFHTGDIGEMLEDQYLAITDRKKEMFKTSGGKYVAPQVIENKFKESRFIEQAMIIGEYQRHPAALIVPGFAYLEEYCKNKNIPYTSREEIIRNPQIITRIAKEIDKLNQNFGHWEQVKKFELLPAEFSVEGGELTPTLKLKRKEILKKYATEIISIYGN